MADDVLTRAGPVAVPLDYKLPTGTEVVPRSISASFNGGAAAGAFVPVLEVIAPTGAVTAYCARQVEIAAGASVLVSWFPGVAEADSVTEPPAASGTIEKITSTLGTISVASPTGPDTSIDLPLTGVIAGTYGDASDVAQVTVDGEGRLTSVATVAIAGGGTVVASDGWVPDTTETWTFASFTAGPPALGTFTVPGDLRAKYTVGTRIRLVQTTTKYFLVVADPTYDGVNTTVSISAGTDYTLANAAIGSNYHSYVVNPQGFPTWFNAAVNAGGFSSLTSNVCQFTMLGRTCTVFLAVTGVSNSSTFTWTAPVAFATANAVPLIVTNNSATQLGRATWAAGSTAVTMGAAVGAAAGFTSSGTKGSSGVAGAYNNAMIYQV